MGNLFLVNLGADVSVRLRRKEVRSEMLCPPWRQVVWYLSEREWSGMKLECSKMVEEEVGFQVFQFQYLALKV